jgi:hypothetical protein
MCSTSISTITWESNTGLHDASAQKRHTMTTSRAFDIKKHIGNRKIRILDKVYVIKFVKNMKSGGFIQENTGEIHVADDITNKYEIRRIILHEVAHALMDSLTSPDATSAIARTKSQIKVEEYIVEFFSRGMCILWIENKEFLIPILEMD